MPTLKAWSLTLSTGRSAALRPARIAVSLKDGARCMIRGARPQVRGATRDSKMYGVQSSRGVASASLTMTRSSGATIDDSAASQWKSGTSRPNMKW